MMKILQLCHKPPLPAIDGGCIAIHHITQGLLQSGAEVKVLAIATPKHSVAPEQLPTKYLNETRFESVFVDTTPKKWPALKSLLQLQSYHVSRFYAKEAVAHLTQILQEEQFDIIHLESLFVTSYISVIRKYSKAKIVYRAHNVEHQIWERMVNHEQRWIQRALFKLLSIQLRKCETELFHRIDGYMAISEPDYQFFRQLAPQIKGTIIPFGVDLEYYEPDTHYIPSDKPKLFHIGSMNWLPNEEGINWFFDEVWPLLHEHFPDITFTLAGRNMPKCFLELQLPNVQVVGEVSDARKFILSKDIMLVPLLSGSGIRIKIVEGMALAKTVITTSIGASGLEVEDGKNILIADTPEEFVTAIGKCIKTPDLCTIMGENAAEYIALHHNNKLIINQLLQFYQEI
ncbi:MAG: glycosyltransferase family 4 protein [Bacteroidales bacterium]|jgi:glycosyltransferase involved in cell wall biosynthesis|nr:glycosyltransferase family 4 protein [Bacteroidales bacterium]